MGLTLIKSKKDIMLNPEQRIQRKEQAPPAAIADHRWRYHHLGIPTNQPRVGERYLRDLKIYISGFDTSPFGIEWMRFHPVCDIHELIQTVPHIAFEVDNLDAALEGREMLGEITSPMEGLRVAMIVDDGAPIELMEFSKRNK